MTLSLFPSRSLYLIQLYPVVSPSLSMFQLSFRTLSQHPQQHCPRFHNIFPILNNGTLIALSYLPPLKKVSPPFPTTLFHNYHLFVPDYIFSFNNLTKMSSFSLLSSPVINDIILPFKHRGCPLQSSVGFVPFNQVLGLSLSIKCRGCPL